MKWNKHVQALCVAALLMAPAALMAGQLPSTFMQSTVYEVVESYTEYPEARPMVSSELRELFEAVRLGDALTEEQDIRLRELLEQDSLLSTMALKVLIDRGAVTRLEEVPAKSSEKRYEAAALLALAGYEADWQTMGPRLAQFASGPSDFASDAELLLAIRIAIESGNCEQTAEFRRNAIGYFLRNGLHPETERLHERMWGEDATAIEQLFQQFVEQTAQECPEDIDNIIQELDTVAGPADARPPSRDSTPIAPEETIQMIAPFLRALDAQDGGMDRQSELLNRLNIRLERLIRKAEIAQVNAYGVEREQQHAWTEEKLSLVRELCIVFAEGY